MSEQEIKAMAALDEAADKAGGYVSPAIDSSMQYDYRKMLQYCRDRGVDPLDLTIREVQQFLIHQ